MMSSIYAFPPTSFNFLIVQFFDCDFTYVIQGELASPWDFEQGIFVGNNGGHPFTAFCDSLAGCMKF